MRRNLLLAIAVGLSATAAPAAWANTKLIRQLAAEAAREVLHLAPGDLKVLDLEFEGRDAQLSGDKDVIAITRVKTKRGDQLVIHPLKAGTVEIVVPRIRGDAELGLRVEVRVEDSAALGRRQELKTVLASERSEMRAERTGIQLKVGTEHLATVAFSPTATDGIQIGDPTIVDAKVVRSKGKNELRLRAVKAGRTAILLRDEQGKLRSRYLISVEP